MSSQVDSAPPAAPMAARRVLIIGIVVVIILAALLAAGIVPRRAQQQQLQANVTAAAATLPSVAATAAQRPTAPITLVLPGTMEALHEAAIYARVPGYVRRWYTDIGAIVRAGEVMAVIDAPELEQSVLQARAQLAQMQSALVLARSNFARWRLLAADSAVTLQELQQMEQAYDAAAANVHAAEANLAGLVSTERYTRVTAPFAGVVVARNVENGALISATGASSTPLTAGGSQLASATTVAAASLFRIAQSDTMRVYISVPQAYAASIRPGQAADLLVQDLGGRSFRGVVARTASAIDAATRTLLTEVDVANSGRALLPGMNARIRISMQRVNSPLVIPSTALVVRTGGPQVIELVPSGKGVATVHLRSVEVARDYGATLEIVSGLADSALVATIGSQMLSNGQRVRIGAAPGDTTKVAVTHP
ncbi:MAG: efflux transporter, family, subunit [Gemmatimonadetes bacterium]|nr:efflux transporter, family, subunit [Gemmatimonadota bacterium]